MALTIPTEAPMNAISTVAVPRPTRASCHPREILRDPLTRLVMASDGVSEQELMALLRRIRRARFPRAAMLAEPVHPGSDSAA